MFFKSIDLIIDLPLNQHLCYVQKKKQSCQKMKKHRMITMVKYLHRLDYTEKMLFRQI